jgi:hypothetical protein
VGDGCGNSEPITGQRCGLDEESRHAAQPSPPPFVPGCRFR